MDRISRIHSLLEKVTGQEATPEECEELSQMLESTGQDKAIDQMNEYFRLGTSSVVSLSETEVVNWKSAAKQITQVNYPGMEISPDNIKDSFMAPVYSMSKPRSWLWVAAAIIFVLVIGGGAYWFISSEKPALAQEKIVNESLKDITPGAERAILTLADGTEILLDSTQNGNLTSQGNTRVVKLDKGQLAYQAEAGAEKKMVYNTLTVPRGGQYSLTLSDGSKVWLNAASSIKYPSSFLGSERIVEISGEAYLEISRNTKHPFKVKTQGTEVLVLGTSFNVNAYPDESSVKTTLIEGAVKIVKASTGNNVVLKPGEQAEVSGNQAEVNVAMVDTEQVLAWKNGLFSFNNADVRTIMRQLSRWYDINIVYEKGVPTQRFYGEMNRNLTLSQVLKGLEAIKVNCKIDGRDLIVLP